MLDVSPSLANHYYVAEVWTSLSENNPMFRYSPYLQNQRTPFCKCHPNPRKTHSHCVPQARKEAYIGECSIALPELWNEMSE